MLRHSLLPEIKTLVYRITFRDHNADDVFAHRPSERMAKVPLSGAPESAITVAFVRLLFTHLLKGSNTRPDAGR
jgi:hypothetical protein